MGKFETQSRLLKFWRKLDLEPVDKLQSYYFYLQHLKSCQLIQTTLFVLGSACLQFKVTFIWEENFHIYYYYRAGSLKR